MKNENLVILVDENDKELGTMEKMEAHRKSKLHRAVSIFISNSQGKWLMQQRAMEKYHSKGVWSNTCCTHPFPSETNYESAHRRLLQEMGMKADLFEIFSFIYKAKLDNELTEYEFDHVFLGISDDKPNLNLDEVMDYKYMDFAEIKQDVAKNPQNYSEWFKKIFERVQSQIKNMALTQ